MFVTCPFISFSVTRSPPDGKAYCNELVFQLCNTNRCEEGEPNVLFPDLSNKSINFYLPHHLITTQTLPSDCYYNFPNRWSVLAVMNLKLQSLFICQRLAQCQNAACSTFHRNKIAFHALYLNSNNYKPSGDNFRQWCRIIISRNSFMLRNWLKSTHHSDAFSPSVILVFGYLMHKKICEIVIYGYVHDKITVSFPGRGMIAVLSGVTCLALLCRNIQ
jgi:hypothetical protein